MIKLLLVIVLGALVTNIIDYIIGVGAAFSSLSMGTRIIHTLSLMMWGALMAKAIKNMR